MKSKKIIYLLICVLSLFVNINSFALNIHCNTGKSSWTRAKTRTPIYDFPIITGKDKTIMINSNVPLSNLTLEIYDSQNQEIVFEMIPLIDHYNTYEVSLNNLPFGTYTLKINQGDYSAIYDLIF